MEFREVFRGDDVSECAACEFEAAGDIELDFFVFVFVGVEEGVECLDVSLPERLLAFLSEPESGGVPVGFEKRVQCKQVAEVRVVCIHAIP